VVVVVEQVESVLVVTVVQVAAEVMRQIQVV
jgi:hypothetical protein